MAISLREIGKGFRYARSFVHKRLVHVNLQLLYDCNFRCSICDFWKDEYRDLPRLSATQAGVIAEKLSEIGPQIVSIGGGEPLLDPEIVDVVRALSRHHFPVMICNGWFVTPSMSLSVSTCGKTRWATSLPTTSSTSRRAFSIGIDGIVARAVGRAAVVPSRP